MKKVQLVVLELKWLERLRRSEEATFAAAAEDDMPAGRRFGMEWAKHHADYSELLSLAKFRALEGDDWLDGFDQRHRNGTPLHGWDILCEAIGLATAGEPGSQDIREQFWDHYTGRDFQESFRDSEIAKEFAIGALLIFDAYRNWREKIEANRDRDLMHPTDND